jgi:ribosomal protein S6--L-glutamate ligase
VVESSAALPAEEAYPGIVFAQSYVKTGRKDLKVFGIGDDVFGVRKEFASDSFLKAGQPAPLSAQIVDLALRCRRAFGLELYGLDVAETDGGPQVIDVNYFPGYRGVPDAANRLADYIFYRAKAAGPRTSARRGPLVLEKEPS